MINNPSTTIYSIYCITNLINKKKYIGFTSLNPPEKRFHQHASGKSNMVISKAICKHGIDNFKFEVILQGKDKEDVLSMETYSINEYNTLSPNGYNMNSGGMHRIISEELKRKLSINNSGKNNPMFGKKHSKESKIKMSLSSNNAGENNPRYGCTVSQNTRKLIGYGNTNKKRSEKFKIQRSLLYTGSGHPLFGTSVSNNTKKKMSEALKGRVINDETKQRISKSLAGKRKYRKFIVELPNGQVQQIEKLGEFCKNNSIHRNTLNKYSNKNESYRGYKILKRY